jgi:tetratricopeptide (TPR) repeat protein
MLAAVYAVSAAWGLTQEQDYPALSMETADKALSLNPDLSMPYAVRGVAQRNLIPRGGTAGWEESLASFSQAIARDQKNTTAILWRGIAYEVLGYFDLALADFRKCLEIDPVYEICRRFLAMTHVLAGRTDEGLRAYEQGLEKGYQNSEALFAAVYAARGDRAAVRALLVLAFPKQPQWVRPIFRSMADPAFAEADRKEAIALLDATQATDSDARFLLRDYGGMPIVDDQNPVWWFRFDAAFLKSDARKKLIRQWRLPDYWRKHGFPSQCHAIGADDFACE